MAWPAGSRLEMITHLNATVLKGIDEQLGDEERSSPFLVRAAPGRKLCWRCGNRRADPKRKNNPAELLLELVWKVLERVG